MTQPTDAFGVRPDPLLEPADAPAYRLPYDDLVDFAHRRLRDEAPELTLDVIARLDRGLDERATWCWLGGDIADLARQGLTVRGFAHAPGPSAHEAVDAPVARVCSFVHRLGLWLTERRPGEGYVACLLRHEAADHSHCPEGMAAELAEFRESRRSLSPASADLGPGSYQLAGELAAIVGTPGDVPAEELDEQDRLALARAGASSARCGFQMGSDDVPCGRVPDHRVPHRTRSPYGDGRWVDYDVETRLEVARSLAWSGELGGPEAGQLVTVRQDYPDIGKAAVWVRGVLRYGRPEVVWVRIDERGEDADELVRWVDVVAAAGDAGGVVLEQYASDRRASGKPWAVTPGLEMPERYVVRPLPSGGTLLRPPADTVDTAATPVDTGDPGLEGAPVRPPLRGLAVELAQAIGSHPELHRPWLPGQDLTPLIDVLRDRLVLELGDGAPARIADLRAAIAMWGTAQTVKATSGAVEIGGIRMEACDTYGRTATTEAFEHLRHQLELLGEVAPEPDVVPETVSLAGRAWLPAFLAYLEGGTDLPLDFGGRPIPHRLEAILVAAFDTGSDGAATPRLPDGYAQRPEGRRMLDVDGQTIRTRDGEEVVAMCSERSWARLLVDAWHTYPLLTPLTGSLAGRLRDAFEGRAVEGLLWEEMAALAQAWMREQNPPDRAERAQQLGSAWDGGLIPSDVGWTPPLTAENALELEARGIDIVGAPITTRLCVCGHERAMHGIAEPSACVVLSSVPGHDCTAFEQAAQGPRVSIDPPAAEAAVRASLKTTIGRADQ